MVVKGLGFREVYSPTVEMYKFYQATMAEAATSLPQPRMPQRPDGVQWQQESCPDIQQLARQAEDV